MIDVVEQLVNAARIDPEREMCAVGLGRAAVTHEIVVMHNVAADPRTAFEMDPVELAALLAGAAADGRELTLIAHSHPSGNSEPSPADSMRAALWPGVLHAIVTPNVEPFVSLYRMGQENT